MRLTLAQLRKTTMPYKVSETLDLSNELANYEDILSVKDCNVDYKISERGNETFEIEFKIKMDLVLQCAVSLVEVPYQIDVEAVERFSTNESLDDAFIIENETLDTKEAVLSIILGEKPMSICAEGVSFESDEDEEEDSDDEDDYINPAFASLKDLL